MATEFRTFDGSHNNLEHPGWGRAGEPLLRRVPAAYRGGRQDPPRGNLRGARDISNRVCAETTPPVPNGAGLSDFIWAWGQFLDHELDLTPEGDEAFPIPIPEDDPHAGTIQKIEFTRSRPIPSTGRSGLDPRQQPNVLSSFIDAANVYGGDATRAHVLRTGQGGRLRTSDGNLLPKNTFGLPNAQAGPAPSDQYFAAGDVRANEHVVLTSMHTLFLREHNRACNLVAQWRPNLKDEEIFQIVRRYISGVMQVITYQEFLPKLLGPGALPAYDGYDSSVNPAISSLFSTACYRLGHSMLPPSIRLADGGSLEFKELFFRPSLVGENGIELYLGGLYRQVMREIDVQATDAVRNFLFTNVTGEALRDLAALNIQRGRDHGLPGYNGCRQALGLPPRRSFAEVSGDPAVVAKLQSAYDHVDDIDPWLGGLAEDHVQGAQVGELIHTVLTDQFQRLRDGDRFYYENDPFYVEHPRLKDLLEHVTLARLLRNNTNLQNVPDDVFVATATP